MDPMVNKPLLSGLLSEGKKGSLTLRLDHETEWLPRARACGSTWISEPKENRWLDLLILEPTLPETNSLLLKINGWKMYFLLGWPIFRGELLVLGSVLFI